MSKKSHKALASATVMSLILTSTLTATVSAATGVERLSGSNRETTAIDVATKVFEKAETVVLVNGYKSADALSATPLAKAYNAPILSVNSVDKPSAELVKALKDLGAKKVVIVGGEGAVTKALATELAETYTVERIEGKDRYETNINVAKKVAELKDSKEAFVVNGSDASYADALSIASIAASKGAPIVFTNGKTVSEEAKALVKDLKVTAIGGTTVVSADVLAAVDATRVAGADRFATNLEVLKAYKDVIKLDNVFVAYGLNFADALVASAAAAKTDAPVVLADKTNTKFTEGATDYIEDNKAAIKNVYLVGGSSVIADSVKNAINSIVNPAVTDLKAELEEVNNVKKFAINFNNAVDADEAEDESNYKIRINNGAALSTSKYTVELSKDGKTAYVVLTDDTTLLQNQKKLKVTIEGDRIESVDGKVLPETTLETTVLDANLPQVTDVTVLGTKGIKIKLSEPVKEVSAKKLANYEIDGVLFIGTIEWNLDEIILRPTTALSAGTHKLTIKSGLEDFVTFKNLEVTKTISVSSDTNAPVIESVDAKLDEVTITFSEAIDPSSLSTSKIKWDDSSYEDSNKTANGTIEKKADNVFKVSFSTNNLPYTTTKLWIKDAKDWSGNTISPNAYSISMKAVIDEARPEVSKVEVSNQDTIKLNWTKAVLDNTTSTGAENTSNYVLKDKDGKQYAVNASYANKVTTLTTTANLEDGEYTLKVSGIVDTTPLANKMLEKVFTLTVEDKSAPTLVGVERYSTDNKLMIKFSEEMAIDGDGSIADLSKYSYATSGLTERQLPEGTTISVSADKKVAVLELPTDWKVGNTTYDVDDITTLYVRLVKDSEDNWMTPLSDSKSITNVTSIALSAATTAEATATDKIKLVLPNVRLAEVYAGDFVVTTGTGASTVTYSVSNATFTNKTSSCEIILELSDKLPAHENSITVKAATDVQLTKTPAGAPIAGTKIATDAIRPTYDEFKVKTGTHDVVVLTFDEALDLATVTGSESDIIIKDSDGNLVATSGYTLSLTNSNKNLEIFFVDGTDIDSYTISIQNPRLIKDVHGNVINVVPEKSFAGIYDSTAPVVTGVTDAQVGDTTTGITPTFTEGTATLATNGGAAVAFTSGTKIDTIGSYVLVVTDAMGNKTTINFTIA